MNRATFEIGRDPEKPDGFRQVSVNDETRPDPADVERVRRAIAVNRARPCPPVRRAPRASEAV